MLYITPNLESPRTISDCSFNEQENELIITDLEGRTEKIALNALTENLLPLDKYSGSPLAARILQPMCLRKNQFRYFRFLAIVISTIGIGILLTPLILHFDLKWTSQREDLTLYKGVKKGFDNLNKIHTALSKSNDVSRNTLLRLELDIARFHSIVNGDYLVRRDSTNELTELGYVTVLK